METDKEPLGQLDDHPFLEVPQTAWQSLACHGQRRSSLMKALNVLALSETALLSLFRPHYIFLFATKRAFLITVDTRPYLKKGL